MLLFSQGVVIGDFTDGCNYGNAVISVRIWLKSHLRQYSLRRMLPSSCAWTVTSSILTTSATGTMTICKGNTASGDGRREEQNFRWFLQSVSGYGSSILGGRLNKLSKSYKTMYE
uniref:Uncharacterized protein n=1 Tax=Corethron hystrix TaxID=216773 RepID=A0A7S1FQV3_9STRA